MTIATVREVRPLGPEWRSTTYHPPTMLARNAEFERIPWDTAEYTAMLDAPGIVGDLLPIGCEDHHGNGSMPTGEVLAAIARWRANPSKVVTIRLRPQPRPQRSFKWPTPAASSCRE